MLNPSVNLCSLSFYAAFVKIFWGPLFFVRISMAVRRLCKCETHMFASVLGILFYVPDNFMPIGLTVSHFISMSDKVGAYNT